jgi:hypothetical protein
MVDALPNDSAMDNQYCGQPFVQVGQAKIELEPQG